MYTCDIDIYISISIYLSISQFSCLDLILNSYATFTAKGKTHRSTIHVCVPYTPMKQRELLFCHNAFNNTNTNDHNKIKHWVQVSIGR